MHPIGQVARLTGLKVTTIRFYEQCGLLPPPSRSMAGRRLYADADVRRLSFIQRARSLGFELEDIRSLLDLTDSPNRLCSEADVIAKRHLAAVEDRIAQLSALRIELTRIVQSCSGGRAAKDCRVIEGLAAKQR
ncbi:MAG: helix-turn-helix domain-containing protein [Hyphomonadaceae bacterium]|nr:helix-turn-helix domain-containing protein [Hyphomonadaceae bacterium]